MIPTDSTLGLPAGFLLGAATSSYQIEGYGDDGRGPSIWDAFCAKPGVIVDGSDGSVACRHLELWRQDVDLLADLGFGAYRFSVSWPRVMPTGRGPVNQHGLDFYDRLVDGLIARGVAPYVTLYHWDLPLALGERGGWTARETAHAFADYAEAVAARLGDRVRSFATLNEPWCSAFLGHLYGEHAPGIRGDRDGMARAVHHLLLGHGLALERLRATAPAAEHGVVLNFTPAYPATDAEADVAAARRHETENHESFLAPLLGGAYPPELHQHWRLPVVAGDLDVISRPMDFLGVNYYTRCLVADVPGAPWPALSTVPSHGTPHTALGWEVYPDALAELLQRLSRRTGLPLYVTENGAAYDDVTPESAAQDGVLPDPERVAYYQQHLAAVARAVAAGADVRGYFAWSLLDNFEWAFGYTKRFGIVHVDFDSQRRTPKRSAVYLGELAAALGTADQATRSAPHGQV